MEDGAVDNEKKIVELAWIDLTRATANAEVPGGLARECSVSHLRDWQLEQNEELLQESDVLLVDFDYPDKTGLALLTDLKSQYTSTPLVMLTTQHSEELAVWAFRSGVWDFLVRPVSNHECRRLLDSLERTLSRRRRQERRNLMNRFEPIPSEASSLRRVPGRDELRQAVNYAQKHFRSKIRSQDVAGLCGMNPFQFSREFRKAYDITFMDYVVRVRLLEACRLLENPNTSVTDVTYAVGFNDTSYFTRVFRRYFGLCPSSVIGHAAPADVPPIESEEFRKLPASW